MQGLATGIGLCLILTGVIVGLISALRKRPEICLFCTIVVFVGLILFFHQRVEEVTIKGVGTIRTAKEQAVTDAQAIADIRRRIENQSATIDLVAERAVEAKTLAEDLDKKNQLAEKRLRDINAALGTTSQTVHYSNIMLAAQSDDASAFEELRECANNKSCPFSLRAGMVIGDIMRKANIGYIAAVTPNPWKTRLDEWKHNPDELQQLLASDPSTENRLRLLEYIDGRKDISNHDKCEFFITAMKTERSLTALDYEGYYFRRIVGLTYHTLDRAEFLKWWKMNADKIK